MPQGKKPSNVVPLRPEPPDITSLSFVTDYLTTSTKRGQRRQTFRCFWSASPSGDYAADNRAGERLALEWLQYARASDMAGSGLLGRVAADMPPKADGLTAGFWSVIGFAAAHGAPQGEALVEYWNRKREA